MLKKISSIVIVFFFLLQIVQGQTFSVVTPSNHNVYFQIENDEAAATYCTYNMPNYGSTLTGRLIIPDSVEYDNVKYPVTSIGPYAFHHAYGIDTVVLPNTIIEIKQEAFCACADLKSVVIPNSVTTLGNLAFAACHQLSDLTIGESVVTIGNQAFDADTSIVSVTIPNSVVSIGQAAFSQNYSLRTIRFGSSLVSIGFACFTYCHNLDSLIFVTDVSPYYSGEFWGTPDTLHIIIPCGSYHSYSYRFGTHHIYTVPTVTLNMSVVSDRPQWGNAIIMKDADSNEVRCDSSVVVKAISNYGYHFLQWSNGRTQVQDTFFIHGDSSVNVLFAKNQYSLTVASFDPSLGSVTGSGVYDYLDTVVITATATAPHYFFERWSDGSLESTHPVVVTGNVALIAYFAIDTHSVSVNADNIAHGSVSGGGRYTYGTVATIMAAPYSGYRFSHWSNGATYNPYVFAVLSDTTLTALFIAEGESYQDTLTIYDTISIHDTTYVPVHDTTYVDVPYPVHDTAIVRDTIYIDILYPVYDTTIVTLTDTITNIVYDTVINYIYDTTLVTVTDTLWLTLHDTIYLPQYIHDTICVHDTIYVGVDEVEVLSVKIYTSYGKIVVEGADGNTVTLYDVAGRILATKRDSYTPLHFEVPSSGTYMIKVGDYSTRRVVVIR